MQAILSRPQCVEPFYSLVMYFSMWTSMMDAIIEIWIVMS